MFIAYYILTNTIVIVSYGQQTYARVCNFSCLTMNGSLVKMNKGGLLLSKIMSLYVNWHFKFSLCLAATQRSFICNLNRPQRDWYTYFVVICRCICSFFSICSIGNCGTSYGAEISFGNGSPSNSCPFIGIAVDSLPKKYQQKKKEGNYYEIIHYAVFSFVIKLIKQNLPFIQINIEWGT